MSDKSKNNPPAQEELSLVDDTPKTGEQPAASAGEQSAAAGSQQMGAKQEAKGKAKQNALDDRPKINPPPRKKRTGLVTGAVLLAATAGSAVVVAIKDSLDADAAKRAQPDVGQLFEATIPTVKDGKMKREVAECIRSDPSHLSEMAQDLETKGVPFGRQVAGRYNELRLRSYDHASTVTIPFNNKGKEGEITMFFVPQNNTNLDGNRLQITVDGATTSWGQGTVNAPCFGKNQKTLLDGNYEVKPENKFKDPKLTFP